MTLVLSCITPNVVYQVSDRRLTRLGTPTTIVDDEANKAVVVNGRVAFGYTGLAEIAGQKTDVWLTKAIAVGPVDQMATIAERVRATATRDFRNLPCQPWVKRQAFQGAGWFGINGGLSPGVILIENALENGRWLREARDDFRVVPVFPRLSVGGSIPGTQAFNVYAVGLDPSDDEKSAVVNLLASAIGHRNSTPSTVLEALIRSMRWLSSRHPEIGPGLMAMCIPKEAAIETQRTGQMVMLMGRPMESISTFLYVSANDSIVHYGPHFVGGGGTAMNFRVTPL